MSTLSFPWDQLRADGLSANTSKPERWVAFGDSVTEGMTYPLWLSQSLAKAGTPTPIWINAGIGGNTTGQMLARLDRDVLAYKPQRIFFNGGVNDVLQAKQNFQQDFRQNVESIFEKIKSAGIPCCVISTIAITGEHLPKNATLKVMNDYLKERATHFGFAYADVFDPFLAGMQAGKVLHEPDHIHLSEMGYSVFVSAILKAIAPKVALSVPWDPQPEPGLLPEWKVSVLDDPSQTWQVHVPEAAPASFWWKDQERKRGFVVNLKDKAPSAKGFVAQATLHLAASTAVLLKVGGQVTDLSLDGQPLPLYPTSHNWGIREGARTSLLPAGDHSIEVKTNGDAFFVSAEPIAST